MKKKKAPAVLTTAQTSGTKEAVVIIHTRREQHCWVEYKTRYDLLWSVNDLLGRRRVPHTVVLQSNIRLLRSHELRQERGGL